MVPSATRAQELEQRFQRESENSYPGQKPGLLGAELVYHLLPTVQDTANLHLPSPHVHQRISRFVGGGGVGVPKVDQSAVPLRLRSGLEHERGL